MSYFGGQVGRFTFGAPLSYDRPWKATFFLWGWGFDVWRVFFWVCGTLLAHAPSALGMIILQVAVFPGASNALYQEASLLGNCASRRPAA